MSRTDKRNGKTPFSPEHGFPVVFTTAGNATSWGTEIKDRPRVSDNDETLSGKESSSNGDNKLDI